MERKRPSKSRKSNEMVSLAMIVVDGSRSRQRIKREYEKVRRDLEQARAELERFEKEDVPGFARWARRQFGELLAELGDTTRKLRELEQLFQEIVAEMFYSGASE